MSDDRKCKRVTCNGNSKNINFLVYFCPMLFDDCLQFLVVVFFAAIGQISVICQWSTPTLTTKN